MHSALTTKLACSLAGEPRAWSLFRLVVCINDGFSMYSHVRFFCGTQTHCHLFRNSGILSAWLSHSVMYVAWHRFVRSFHRNQAVRKNERDDRLVWHSAKCTRLIYRRNAVFSEYQVFLLKIEPIRWASSSLCETYLLHSLSIWTEPVLNWQLHNTSPADITFYNFLHEVTYQEMRLLYNSRN